MKAIITSVLLIVAAAAIYSSCKKGNSFTSVNVQEFANAIAQPGTQIVDVRTAEEYATGNIDGSINIDVKKDNFKEIATTLLNKEKNVALYCRSGRRSKLAADILSAQGYSVVELDGGYNEWTKHHCAK